MKRSVRPWWATAMAVSGRTIGDGGPQMVPDTVITNYQTASPVAVQDPQNPQPIRTFNTLNDARQIESGAFVIAHWELDRTELEIGARASTIDQQNAGVWHAMILAVRFVFLVEDTQRLDSTGFRVAQHRESQFILHLKFSNQFRRFVDDGCHADTEGLKRVCMVGQLDELFNAIGSPYGASREKNDQAVFATKFGESDALAIRVEHFQCRQRAADVSVGRPLPCLRQG